MIDTHGHLVHSQLPGSKGDPTFFDRPEGDMARLICEEMADAGVEQLLAMGSLGAADSDPLGVDGTLRIQARVPGVHAIGVADPRRTDSAHLDCVERELERGRVRALKGYSGYIHFGPDSPAYEPYYALAARYCLPFIFHTGDTYSTRAKLKYAHPLLVDEAAVDHPDVQFVIAHMGNPWLMDAAEVVYKNDNVWADLSGILIGDDPAFEEMERTDTLQRVATRVAEAIEFSERPDRILYGSDWPLAPMGRYRRFAEMVVPKAHHLSVFHDNAVRLFRL